MKKARNGKSNGKSNGHGKVRYGVVGLGHFAQVAILPAFAHATKNSELVALVSDDATKLKKLGKKYDIPEEMLLGYQDYDRLCESGELDAVYIALPNSLHCEYGVRAAERGVHVLCEKPLAVTEADCERMIEVARDADVRLMTAYRLHFEEANLTAIDLVRRGRIGEPRIFSSVFTMQVREGNIRVERELGGGPVYDIGIYCINAARYLFRAEPIEVTAFAVNNGEERFAEIDEAVSAVLRFPDDRLAQLTVSFGAADTGFYTLHGTEGELCLDPAYTYHDDLTLEWWAGERSKAKTFPKRDQIAPEILHFSECITRGKEPEPNGWEGLADVRVIRAIHESVRTGRPVKLAPFDKRRRPTLAQEERRPAVREPEVVHAQPPGR